MWSPQRYHSQPKFCVGAPSCCASVRVGFEVCALQHAGTFLWTTLTTMSLVLFNVSGIIQLLRAGCRVLFLFFVSVQDVLRAHLKTWCR